MARRKKKSGMLGGLDFLSTSKKRKGATKGLRKYLTQTKRNMKKGF